MMQQEAKALGDYAAGSVAFATFVGWMPDIAALAALIYTCLRIFEWFEKRKQRREWFDKRAGHDQ
jgi:hypothetical protein